MPPLLAKPRRPTTPANNAQSQKCRRAGALSAPALCVRNKPRCREGSATKRKSQPGDLSNVIMLKGSGAPHRINITNTCRRSYYSSNARNRRFPPSVVAFDRRRYKLTGYQLWTSHLAQLARTHVMSVFRRSCVTPPKTRSFQRPCARPPATKKSTPSFSAYSAITEASDRPLAGRC